MPLVPVVLLIVVIRFGMRRVLKSLGYGHSKNIYVVLISVISMGM